MKIFLLLIFSSIISGSFCQNSNSKKSGGTQPFVLGVIEELPSSILKEKRTLNIYLPEGYDAADSITYPVVYLLDGSADEDFIHVVGLYQFNNFSWINRVPKSIVVGIANVDRKRDFTFSTNSIPDRERHPTAGHSAQFIDFIEKELQPFINKRYRSNHSATLIGQSLGGLLATEILFTKPTLFNTYIIISPSIWWDNGSLLKKEALVLEASFVQKTNVYIGVGKEGLTPGDSPRVMEVDANLLAEKIQYSKSKTVTAYFEYLPQEDHATIGHQAIFNALRLIYPAAKEK